MGIIQNIHYDVLFLLLSTAEYMPILLQKSPKWLKSLHDILVVCFCKKWAYLFARQTLTGAWLGPENAGVRRDTLQRAPCLPCWLLGSGISHTLRSLPSPTQGARGKGGSWLRSFEWTCWYFGVPRIQWAADKLETAALAACGVRPDVCMVSIDDKVSVISRPPLLLRELTDSWRHIPGFLPAQCHSLGLAIYLWQNLYLKLSPNSTGAPSPRHVIGGGSQESM